MARLKEIAIIILSLFLLSLVSGFVYGEHKYGSRMYREHYIMRGAKVYVHQNQVTMQIGCNPHHPFVKLNFDHHKTRMLSQSDYLNYIVKNTQSNSAIELDPTIAAEVLAGFMGGKKIPDLIASLKPLDDQKEKVGEVVSSVLAVAFGFDAGKWVAQKLSNSCSRDAIYETALTKSFWKRLKRYVVAIYLKEYDNCQPPPLGTKSSSAYNLLSEAREYDYVPNKYNFEGYNFGGYPSGQYISSQELFPGVPWFEEGKYLRSFTKQFERDGSESMDNDKTWRTIDNNLHVLERNVSDYQKHVEKEHPLIKAAYSEARFIKNGISNDIDFPISLRNTQIIGLVDYIKFDCSRLNENLVWSPSSRRARSRTPHRHN